jgi:hypothetical protein
VFCEGSGYGWPALVCEVLSPLLLAVSLDLRRDAGSLAPVAGKIALHNDRDIRPVFGGDHCDSAAQCLALN